MSLQCNVVGDALALRVNCTVKNQFALRARVPSDILGDVIVGYTQFA